jgi:hypothetical protein
MAGAKPPDQAGASQYCKKNDDDRAAFSPHVHPSNRFNLGCDRSKLGGKCKFRWKVGRFGGRAIFFIDRRRAKLGYVIPGREVNPKLVLVSRIVVVLSNSFAYLPGSYADYWIVTAVGSREPPENLDPEGSLFEGIFLPLKRLLDDIPEEWRISFALTEQRARQYPLKLILDQHAFLSTQGRPNARSIFGYRHRRALFEGNAPYYVAVKYTGLAIARVATNGTGRLHVSYGPGHPTLPSRK